MSFTFASPTPRRRPSLTPMIDVVFLLLVFFMLAARFGQDSEISLSPTGTGISEWSGPPRLIDITPDALRLNGQNIASSALFQSLTRLVETETDPILLRPDSGTDTQRLIDVMGLLRAEGFTNLLLIAP
ncbi:MAG TPA: biopolymer transporter ExbD [Roseibacterium sp.]|nr:biopolymer transporter ExbD [Roseibacterium sp.]